MATYTVAGSANDAQERADNTNFSATANPNSCTANTGGTSLRTNCAFQWSGVQIPPGATILTAVVQVWPTAGDDPLLTIRGNNVDSANDFTTEADVTNRTLTTANVAWNANNIGTGAYKNSPDISTIIQEIVNRAGWAAGNSICVIFVAGTTANRGLTASSGDGVAGQRPRLVVTWRVTATPSPVALTLSTFAPTVTVAPWIPRPATSNSTAGATSLSVNKPAGAGAGTAVALTIVFSSTHGGLTPPIGFTALDDAVNRWSGYRILDGSEGSTFDFSWITNRSAVIVCTAATPLVGSAALSDAGVLTASGTTTHPTDDITVGNNAWLTAHWTMLAPGGVNTWTTADLLEAVDVQSGTGPTAMAATGVQAAAGATGVKNATSSVSGNGRSFFYGFVSVNPQLVTPTTAALTLTTFAPDVDVSGGAPAPLDINVLASGSNATTAGQTLTTGSITPTLGGKLFVFAYSQSEAHTTAANIGVTDSAGGSWTRDLQSASVQWGGAFPDYLGRGALFSCTPTGTARTITIDGNTGTTDSYFISYVVFELVPVDGNIDIGDLYQQASVITATAEGGGDSESGAVSLGSNPDADNYVIVAGAKANDVASAVSAPTGYDELVNNTGIYSSAFLFYRTGTTSPTATFSDLGEDIGIFAAAILEIKMVPTGPPGDVEVTPPTATLVTTRFTPTVSAPRRVTPGTTALTLTTFIPTVRLHKLVVPATRLLVLAIFAPVIRLHKLVTPATRALVLTTFAPTIRLHKLVTPGARALVLTTFTPTVRLHKLVTPATVSLVITRFVPTVRLHKIAVPATRALVISTFTPTIRLHKIVTPATRILILTRLIPTIALSNNQRVTPTMSALTLTRLTPTVPISNHQRVTPTTRVLALATFAPTVTRTAHQRVTPETATLVLTGNSPSVTTGDAVEVQPDPATLVITSFAPTVINPQRVTPATAVLTLTRFAPQAWAPRLVTPGTRSLVLTPFTSIVTTPLRVTPATTALTLTRFVPAARVFTTVRPTTRSLVLTTFPPVIAAGADVVVVPEVATLVLTANSPSVTTGDNIEVQPDSAVLVITGLAPTIITPVRVTPVVTVLVLTLLTPTVLYPQSFVPATRSLVLTTFPPAARIMGASTVLNDAIAIYLGESIVEAVYVGAEQVWP